MQLLIIINQRRKPLKFSKKKFDKRNAYEKTYYIK